MNAAVVVFVAALALAIGHGQSIGATSIRRTRYRAPYDNGRTAYPLRDRPGVYLIKEQSAIVYIGYSASDVYKACYRHFQSWTDPNQERATYDPDAVTVRMVYTRTGTQAASLERALIVQHRPRDNLNKYSQYSLTDADVRTIDAADNAPWMPTDEVAPF